MISGRQLKAARALVGMDQIRLARQARVAIGTVRRMESFEGEIESHTATLSKVRATLERAGIEFLYGEQPGVRLKAANRQDDQKPRK